MIRSIVLSIVVLAASASAAPLQVRVAPVASPASSGLAPVPALLSGSPLELRSRYNEATARLQSTLDAIAEIPPGRATFQNTFLAFDRAFAEWDTVSTAGQYLGGASPNEKIARRGQLIGLLAGRFQTAVLQREDLYKVLASVDLSGLDALDRRNAEKLLDAYKEGGFHLPPEKRRRLKELNDRLAKIGNDFSSRLANDRETHAVTLEQLKGLPQSYIDGLKDSRDAQGYYHIPVKPAMVGPFLTYAEDAEQRRLLLQKSDARGGDDNLALWKEVLPLRRELAELHGFKSYPDYKLKDRMAGTGAKAMEFLLKIKDKVAEQAKADKEELLAFKRETDPDAAEVFPWERSYLSRKLNLKKIGLDPQEVRNYFEAGSAIKGVMGLYEELFGIRIAELEGAPSWHPSVKLYRVSDARTGRLLGRFYMDLYNRPGKRDGAAMYPLIQGRSEPNGYRRPASAIIADFEAPAPGQPKLFYHREVETIVHEMGHNLHNILTVARHAAQAGTNVAWDAVETPSQMPEKFLLEREVLKKLARHHETGEPMPDAMIDKLIAGSKFQKGLFYAGQLAYAVGDLRLHMEIPEDPGAFFSAILEEFMGFKNLPGSKRLASFTHIMGGYSAGYYSYLWADQLAYWVYSLFGGKVDPAVGARVRETIYSQGSQKDFAELLKELGGEVPFSAEPFLRELEPEPGA